MFAFGGGAHTSVPVTSTIRYHQGVDLGIVEEGVYAAARWVPGRRLNGDETPEWRALWFPGDRYGIQHVKPYRYR